MSNEERLEEAKRLFPIGTKFNNQNIKDYYNGLGVSIGIPFFDKNDIRVLGETPRGSQSYFYIYLNEDNVWAKILETPVQEKQEPQYEIY